MTAMDGPILNKRVSPLDGKRFSLKSSFDTGRRRPRLGILKSVFLKK